MLSKTLTPAFIAHTEAMHNVTNGDRLMRYVNAVQADFGLDTKSPHWTYQRSIQAHLDGMPSLGEIVDYLRDAGVHRYA